MKKPLLLIVVLATLAYGQTAEQLQLRRESMEGQAVAAGGTCNATAGDWNSVAACVNSATDGGTVFVPAATYHATSTIVNNGKAITIKGETTCVNGAKDTTCTDRTILVYDVAG